MNETTIALPRLALIGATRGMLGIGIGFLLSEKLSSKTRIYAGIALAAIGALSTIPLALGVFRRVKPANGYTKPFTGEGLAAD